MLQGKVVAKTQWDNSHAIGDDEETEVRHPALRQANHRIQQQIRQKSGNLSSPAGTFTFSFAGKTTQVAWTLILRPLRRGYFDRREKGFP